MLGDEEENLSEGVLISDAFEDLAQSLRVLLEADFRARAGLLLVDRAEAVGNIEAALAGVLNAFHSIYDAMAKEPPAGAPDWYGEGELAIVLALRNARHHNQARKIRTLYTYHFHEAERHTSMEQYVYVDFPSSEEGGDTFDVFMSWADLKLYLDMPSKENRLRPSARDTILQYLHAEKFPDYAATFSLPEDRVVFNVVPLIVNAAIRIVPVIQSKIRADSTEADAFAEHFSSMSPASTENPEVDAGPFVLGK